MAENYTDPFRNVDAERARKKRETRSERVQKAGHTSASEYPVWKQQPKRIAADLQYPLTKSPVSEQEEEIKNSGAGNGN